MEDQIVNLLAQFISFQSIHGNNAAKGECLDWVETAFFSSVQTIKRGDVDGCPYLYVPRSNAKLLLFAHFDVVPAEPKQFTLRIDEQNRKAYGRGVMDMKGPALPFLYVYKNLCDAGQNPPVSILLTTDEETAGRTIPTLIEEGVISAPVAFTPDTGTKIVTEHKGVVWAELRAHGKGGHASRPWEGINPIEELTKALNILSKEFPKGSSEDWQITVTPTQLSGSRARNQIPDTATAAIDIRFVPSQHATAGEAVAAVQAVLPDSCELNVVTAADPLYTDKNHPMVQKVKQVAENIAGKPIEFEREHGGTDARYFSAAGIPAFLYGPEGGNIHANNEWVSIDSLLEHVAFYEKLIAEL